MGESSTEEASVVEATVFVVPSLSSPEFDDFGDVGDSGRNWISLVPAMCCALLSMTLLVEINASGDDICARTIVLLRWLVASATALLRRLVNDRTSDILFGATLK